MINNPYNENVVSPRKSLKCESVVEVYIKFCGKDKDLFSFEAKLGLPPLTRYYLLPLLTFPT